MEYENGLKDKLKPFSDFLGSKKFFVSDEITFVDFHMYEVLDVLKTFSPKSIEEFPNLVSFLKRFEEIPQIKAYMESERYIVVTALIFFVVSGGRVMMGTPNPYFCQLLMIFGNSLVSLPFMTLFHLPFFF